MQLELDNIFFARILAKVIYGLTAGGIGGTLAALIFNSFNTFGQIPLAAAYMIGALSAFAAYEIKGADVK